MDSRLNPVVVVDIEATCWTQKRPPTGQHSEIIEVGVCLLDLNTLTPSDKASLLVKPTRSTVSEFCTQLTTLTQEQVDGGMTLAEACAVLVNEYQTPERVWVSWGDYDRRMFRDQCQSFGLRYPFSERHVNVKHLHMEVHKLKRGLGMARALELAEIPLEGVHHRGGDDAWNIAKLLGHLLNNHSDTLMEKLV